MFRANTCQQETMIFFSARDLSLIEELALLGPQVMLPLLLKFDCCKHVIWTLAGPRVENGHFPLGKAAAINIHPHCCCPVPAPFDCQKIVEQPPLQSDLNIKSTERKTLEPKN